MSESMSDREIEYAMEKLDKWSLQSNAIAKRFKFAAFKDSIRFVNLVADLADTKNHHPDVHIRYCNVDIVLSTHSKQAVTLLDIEFAVDVDSIFTGQ